MSPEDSRYLQSLLTPGFIFGCDVFGFSENDGPRARRSLRIGQDQMFRTLKVMFKPVLPHDVKSAEEIQAWIAQISGMILGDLKHSQTWHCVGCDKFAKDVITVTTNSKIECLFSVYMVCDAELGSCRDFVQSVYRRVNSSQLAQFTETMTDQPRVKYSCALPPGENSHALAASCAGCKSETTAIGGLSRCGKCKVIRYCSIGCQTQDWTRHKKVCKMIKAHKWVGS